MRVYLTYMLSLVSSACVTTPQAADMARDAVHRFHRHLQWGAFSQARQLLSPKASVSPEVWLRLESGAIELKGFEFHELAPVQSAAEEFDVYGEVDVIDTASQRVNHLRISEHWHKVDDRWVCEPYWLAQLEHRKK